MLEAESLHDNSLINSSSENAEQNMTSGMHEFTWSGEGKTASPFLKGLPYLNRKLPNLALGAVCSLEHRHLRLGICQLSIIQFRLNTCKYIVACQGTGVSGKPCLLNMRTTRPNPLTCQVDLFLENISLTRAKLRHKR